MVETGRPAADLRHGVAVTVLAEKGEGLHRVGAERRRYNVPRDALLPVTHHAGRRWRQRAGGEDGLELAEAWLGGEPVPENGCDAQAVRHDPYTGCFIIRADDRLVSVYDRHNLRPELRGWLDD